LARPGAIQSNVQQALIDTFARHLKTNEKNE
jgi:hypothetical protein